MKVQFSTTTRRLIQYGKYYFEIRKQLIELGCVIVDDWLPGAYEFKKKTPKAKRQLRKNYENLMDGINRSDFVVIEYTVPNFSTSHQILHASMRRKPVLVLRLKRDNSYADSYIEMLDSKYITVKDYNLNNLGQTLKEFMGLVEIGQGYKRYNLVLEQRHKHYLDWATVKYKKSRSEIVRDALDDKSFSDRQYREYIS